MDIALVAQIVVAVSAVLVPVLASLHRSNLKRFDSLEHRIDHMDECFDKLRLAQHEAMLRATAESRGYVLRTDLEIELSRLRSAIGNEIASNSNGISRLISDVSDLKARIAAVEALQRTNIRRISDLMGEKG